MSINHKRGNTGLKLVGVGVVLFWGIFFLCPPAMVLSPEMEADRLLMVAAKYTDQGKYNAAAAEFTKILDLKTKLPAEFYYQYGRHFYAIREFKKAGENMETYLKKAGAKGQHYRQALQMLTAIEERQKKLSRFVDHSNGTVTDTKTGLMWAAKDNGRSISWQDANAYCQSYSGGGHTDWRLPAPDELASLYDPEDKNRHGYHVTELIDISACYVWTSEIRNCGRGLMEATFFSFIRGKSSLTWPSSPPNDTGQNHALPVRSGN